MSMRETGEVDCDHSANTRGTPRRGSLLAAGAAALLVSASLQVHPERARAQENNKGASESSRDVRGGSLSQRTTRDYHEVDKGDTLWDLSGRYYGDSYRWPRMWSYNPHITNPHWIYPGDIIYLRPPRKEPTPTAEREGRKGRRIRTGGGDVEEGLRLMAGGFVTRQKPEYVGRIVASPKEARLLGQYDSCWVGFGSDGYTDRERDKMKDKNIRNLKDPGEVQKKDRFAIVTKKGPIENEDGDVIGHKYLVMGSLVVTKTNDEKLDTALIEQSWREIERGAFLVPYQRQLRVVDHVEADQDMVAEIVDSLRGNFDFGQYDYVFVNKGASDGVRIGNRFYAYQRKAGLPNRWGAGEWNGETPDEIPWRRVGRLRVIDVTENYSTAIVTRSKRELNRGDRLEMYEGD